MKAFLSDSAFSDEEPEQVAGTQGQANMKKIFEIRNDCFGHPVQVITILQKGKTGNLLENEILAVPANPMNVFFFKPR